MVAEDDAGDDAIWCHVHQKKSIGSTVGSDVWRAFLIRLTLGDADAVSSALTEISRPDVGLVSAFDPHIMGWGASARLVPERKPVDPDAIRTRLLDYLVALSIGQAKRVAALEREVAELRRAGRADGASAVRG